jgi:hypothetical protein
LVRQPAPKSSTGLLETFQTGVEFFLHLLQVCFFDRVVWRRQIRQFANCLKNILDSRWEEALKIGVFSWTLAAAVAQSGSLRERRQRAKPMVSLRYLPGRAGKRHFAEACAA